MVRLTIDLIARGTSGYTKKKREESMPNYLKRLTHLYLEDKKIDETGDDTLSMCRNLSVLYLYDNQIPRIPNLLSNMNLTHLYLQNNQISKIDNIGHLSRLTKLYLGGNHLCVVEGLERLDHLQELHVENQRLPAGEELLFDPRTLDTLSRSLLVLNVSANNLATLRDLDGLRYLQQFFAADNKLRDMKELSQVFGQWQLLSKLELSGNPLCDKPKYRDRVIVMCNSLEQLDGKEVSALGRTFLKNWKETKEANKEKRRRLSRQKTDISLYSEKSRDLPPVRGTHSSAPSSGYIMPGLHRKQFDEILARSASQHTRGAADTTALSRKLSDPAGGHSVLYRPPYNHNRLLRRSADYRHPRHPMLHKPITRRRLSLINISLGQGHGLGQGHETGSNDLVPGTLPADNATVFSAAAAL